MGTKLVFNEICIFLEYYALISRGKHFSAICSKAAVKPPGSVISSYSVKVKVKGPLQFSEGLPQ